jgi:hypothetical protein
MRLGANIINYGLFALIYGTQLLGEKKLPITALSTDVYVSIAVHLCT